MERKVVKRPEYDGTACMLYDFMVAQNMTEEMIAQAMGKEINIKAPWNPVSRWIMHPESLSQTNAYMICKVLNAPLEVLFTYSRVLNGKEFHLGQYYVRKEKQNIKDIDEAVLIEEIRQRGYKVYKEV